ncbi:MAG: 4-hydroxybenzoate octaprenyltransferase [Candidatus Paracaedibacteraceae bacterium]|nr:4-hydroxybenzoate octaprenyltransferase [Candidatus Paracaedibacteraceae bacterium]
MLNALLRLGRFDKPIGIVLILFPCWWGLAYIQGFGLELKFMLLFALGATVMRAAGCIVNDYFDRDVDQQVARTKHRPLASGEVSLKAAFWFFWGLCAIGLWVLLQFPVRCWIIGVVATVLLMIYPLAKRFTAYPQVVLGLAFNIGFPMAVAIFTPNIFHYGVLAGYCAGILWTVAYDTVYAFQDIEDDRHLDIGSTALVFEKAPKLIVTGIYLGMGILLSLSCYLAHSSFLPYLFFVGAVVYSVRQLSVLNLKDVNQCREFFIANQWVGALVFLGYLMR